MATTTLQENPSPNASSADETSWDDLEEAQPVIALPIDNPIPDKLPGKVPYCAVCGEEIVRAPGARGRAPKYHPDCRPSANKGSTGSVSARGGRTKAVSEADEAVAAFKGLVIKGVLLISVIDRFDAFCIMVALPDVCENLHGILLRYPKFRQEMLALKSGGSMFALGLTVIMCIAPMAAHHGLIPHKGIAQALVQAPFALHKIHQKLAEGEAGLTRLMEEQLKATADAKKEAESREAENAAA